MIIILPIVVPVPTAALINGAVKIPFGSRQETTQDVILRRLDASLNALTSGTLTVEVRSLADNRLMGTLAWSVAGLQSISNIDQLLNGVMDGLSFDVTGIAIGASTFAYITTWLAV